jgi:hypothetical protein
MPDTYFSERLATAISTTIAAQLGVQPTVGDLARFPPRALTDATDAVIQKMPEFVDFWSHPSSTAMSCHVHRGVRLRRAPRATSTYSSATPVTNTGSTRPSLAASRPMRA